MTNLTQEAAEKVYRVSFRDEILGTYETLSQARLVVETRTGITLPMAWPDDYVIEKLVDSAWVKLR